MGTRASERIRIWLLVSVVWLSSYSAGDNHEMAKPMADVNDVRILIDVSGSMRQNDPQNLRVPALELLIELLPEGTQAGVWTFGQYVNMLVPYGEVNAAWKANARSRVDQIKSLGLRTAIGEALEKSSFDFDYTTNTWHKNFILLTDGMVDISRNRNQNVAERNRIINQVLPKFRDHDATVHTISLSDNADSQLLEQLANQTQGLSVVAKSADELMAFFLRAFDLAVPSEQVPLTDQGFSIDTSVNEFTALMFRETLSQPLRLIAPNGEMFTPESETSRVNWVSTDRYDLVTVQQPMAGKWAIDGSLDDNSRVTVVSDLNLMVQSLPTVLYPLQENLINAHMKSLEGVVMESTFVDLMSMTLTTIPTDTTMPVSSGQMIREGHEFVYPIHELITQQGAYQVEVMLDGRTFQRQISRSVEFMANLSVEIAPQSDHYLIRIFPNNPAIDQQGSFLLAQITDVNGQVDTRSFDLQTAGYWQLKIDSAEAGVVQVKTISKIMMAGQQVDDLMIEPMALTFPVSGTMPMAVEVADDTMAMVEPEPEPEPMVVYQKFPLEMVEEIDPNQLFQDEPPMETEDTMESMEEGTGEDDVKLPEDSPSVLSYLMWSVPGLLALAGFFFAYRWFDQRKHKLLEEREALARELEEEGAMPDLSVPDEEPLGGGGEPELLDDPVAQIDAEIAEKQAFAPPEPNQTDPLASLDEGFDLGDLADITEEEVADAPAAAPEPPPMAEPEADADLDLDDGGDLDIDDGVFDLGDLSDLTDENEN